MVPSPRPPVLAASSPNAGERRHGRRVKTDSPARSGRGPAGADLGFRQDRARRFRRGPQPARRGAGLDRRHGQGAAPRPALPVTRRLRAHRLSRDDGRPGQDAAPAASMAGCWACATIPSTPRRCERTASADRPAGRQSLSVRGDGARAGAAFATCIENIDIGGPAMIRAAAKNHALRRRRRRSRRLCRDRSRRWRRMAARPDARLAQALAAKAFARTAAYDAAIAELVRRRRSASDAAAPGDAFGGTLRRACCATARTRISRRRFYRRRRAARPGVATAAPGAGQGALLQQHQRHRRRLRAGRRVRPGRGRAVAIIKHANPCGVGRRRRRWRRPTRKALRLRSGLGLRRHRRAQPRARRRDGRGDRRRSSPR